MQNNKRRDCTLRATGCLMALEIIMIVILLLTALFLVVAVLFQKSKEDGLSGAISGKQDTFYGKDSASRTDRILRKWTMIAGIIFAVAVLVIYIIQPDYHYAVEMNGWKDLSQYSDILF